MKKCYLDSNVLIYFKNEDSPQHQIVSELLVNLRKQGFLIHISSLVLDEFLYAMKFILKRKKNENLYIHLEQALRDILDIPAMQIIHPSEDKKAHLEVVRYMEKYYLSPRDAYHLLTMQGNGIESFATFDTDFKKVFAAKILTKA